MRWHLIKMSRRKEQQMGWLGRKRQQKALEWAAANVANLAMEVVAEVDPRQEESVEQLFRDHWNDEKIQEMIRVRLS